MARRRRPTNNIFSRVANVRPRRNSFDMSYNHLSTGHLGELYPVYLEHCVPGDTFKIANEVVIRFLPLVAPIMHEINCTVHYFFVPFRILWDDWEEFITGGDNGDSIVPIPTFADFPWFDPDNVSLASLRYSLWDYFGFPIYDPNTTRLTKEHGMPIDMPWRAYNLIWNDYYRDQDLQDEVEYHNNGILRRNWTKDYFTSARPWQQKGQAPALALSGTAPLSGLLPVLLANITPDAVLQGTTGSQVPQGTSVSISTSPNLPAGTNPLLVNLEKFVGGNPRPYADLTGAGTFDVSDMRFIFQLQRWLERNARTGSRYVEALKAHYGVSPRDERLNRPEYIGGTRAPVTFSEVLQTSETSTGSPQGNMAGHGLMASGNFAGSHYVAEHGLIMGILSVMPKPSYSQGMDRRWTYYDKFEFYFPEFAHLSEQAIYNREIRYTGSPQYNNLIFGYQGRYDEMRVRHDQVVSDFRPTVTENLASWHLSRNLPGNTLLNSTFITCRPDEQRIMASNTRPPLLIHVRNLVRAIRPLPLQSAPGLIDHV